MRWLHRPNKLPAFLLALMAMVSGAVSTFSNVTLTSTLQNITTNSTSAVNQEPWLESKNVLSISGSVIFTVLFIMLAGWITYCCAPFFRDDTNDNFTEDKIKTARRVGIYAGLLPLTLPLSILLVLAYCLVGLCTVIGFYCYICLYLINENGKQEGNLHAGRASSTSVTPIHGLERADSPPDADLKNLQYSLPPFLLRKQIFDRIRSANPSEKYLGEQHV